VQRLRNIFWLGIKETRSLFSDVVLVCFLVWAFSFAIYLEAREVGETVNNASIAFVDEDHSALSRKLISALYPPHFKQPDVIEPTDIDRLMDESRYMFVVVVPPRFEADVRRGRTPALQVNIDATAVMQAALGAGYIERSLLGEIQRFVNRSDEATAVPVALVSRRAFNPNGTQSWFASIVALLNQISLLTITLTGAALLREREHGTIEHLLVMPITSFEIAIAKVWANGLVVLAGFALSLLIVAERLIGVPIAGSKLLLLAGTTVYLFAAAAIGIFLATIARTMAQFSLLMLMTIIPVMMLSGGMSPIESQPAIIQPITWFLPSRHYMAFAQAVAFRGAGLEIVWPQFLTVAVQGLAFFSASLVLFRRSIAAAK